MTWACLRIFGNKTRIKCAHKSGSFSKQKAIQNRKFAHVLAEKAQTYKKMKLMECPHLEIELIACTNIFV